MPGYTREQIREHARRGNSITFLKSQRVAEAVGKKVEAELIRQKVGGAQVEVRQDSRHPGAWIVWVMHITHHTPRSSDMARAHSAINSAESRAISEILDRSYTPEDLLTSWSLPQQR